MESATPWRVPGGPLRRSVGVALGVVLVAAVLWAAFRPADTRLYESIWELESATFEGSAVDIETNNSPVSWEFHRRCDSGPGSGPGCTGEPSLTVRGGCGWISTPVVYDDSSVSWTGDAREIAPGCVGEITRAVIAVGGSGSFGYSFNGDRLAVSAPDDSAQLVFRSRAKVGWGD